MEQRIIDAISVALDSVFPDIPILDMQAEQDVSRPAFFISCIQSILSERIIHAHFFITFSFDILFDPGVKDPEIKCREVQSELMLLLRRIPDLKSEFAFRPFNIHFEEVDGMLHALFDVQESIIPETEKDPVVERYQLQSKAGIK